MENLMDTHHTLQNNKSENNFAINKVRLDSLWYQVSFTMTHVTAMLKVTNLGCKVMFFGI